MGITMNRTMLPGVSKKRTGSFSIGICVGRWPKAIRACKNSNNVVRILMKGFVEGFISKTSGKKEGSPRKEKPCSEYLIHQAQQLLLVFFFDGEQRSSGCASIQAQVVHGFLQGRDPPLPGDGQV